MPQHTAVCPHCAQSFTSERTTGRPPKYCSTSCRTAASYQRAKADGRCDQWVVARRAKRQPARHHRVCVMCNAEFEGRANAKYCSKLCIYKAERERQAAIGYRRRPDVVAKRKAYGRVHRQRAKVTATCVVCGGEWQANWKAKTQPVSHCSPLCVSIGRYGERLSLVPDTHPSRSTEVPADHPARRKPQATRFMSGRCPHCGDWYLADRLAFSRHTDRTCSNRCAKRMANVRRRAAERDAFVSPVNRFEIFERDGWMCMLCGDPIERDEVSPHPLSPSIDHVIPLARGGTHEPGNVQAAHLLCNSLKGDRVELDLPA